MNLYMYIYIYGVTDSNIYVELSKQSHNNLKKNSTFDELIAFAFEPH